MQVHSFLGPMTALTAAGFPPMGSVFAGVATADQLLGRDTTRILPSVRARSARKSWERNDVGFAGDTLPCGCGA